MAQRHDKVSLRGYMAIKLIVGISRASYALLQMKCSFEFGKMHGTDSYAQI